MKGLNKVLSKLIAWFFTISLLSAVNSAHANTADIASLHALRDEVCSATIRPLCRFSFALLELEIRCADLDLRAAELAISAGLRNRAEEFLSRAGNTLATVQAMRDRILDLYRA